MDQRNDYDEATVMFRMLQQQYQQQNQMRYIMEQQLQQFQDLPFSETNQSSKNNDKNSLSVVSLQPHSSTSSSSPFGNAQFRRDTDPSAASYMTNSLPYDFKRPSMAVPYPAVLMSPPWDMSRISQMTNSNYTINKVSPNNPLAFNNPVALAVDSVVSGVSTTSGGTPFSPVMPYGLMPGMLPYVGSMGNMNAMADVSNNNRNASHARSGQGNQGAYLKPTVNVNHKSRTNNTNNNWARRTMTRGSVGGVYNNSSSIGRQSIWYTDLEKMSVQPGDKY
uniref:Uncharacterized protein n=1 Tax=Polytomella parva TaxID=51329 RepID=A0A7S0UT13_9CHLO